MRRRVTEKTITDQDLRNLRNMAMDANDYDTAALCDLAIDGEIDLDDYTVVSGGASRELRGMTQSEAVARCVELFNELTGARAEERSEYDV